MKEYKLTIETDNKEASGSFKSNLSFNKVRKLVASFVKGNLENE